MSDYSHIAPYAEAHKSPKGPGDSRPTALQIVRNEDLVDKWRDKTILITGASSGIGVETARALHATGARIFITTRDIAKGEKVVQDIISSSPSQVPIEILFMELDSLISVKAAADDFLARSKNLNILINNAGAMASGEKIVTADGFEHLFQVNYLSSFLFTKLLLPTLIASSTSVFESRVVNLSSTGHLFHNPDGLTPEVLSDLNFNRTPYNQWAAYGQSKTANILHANQLDRLYGSDPGQAVHAFSLHPGGITTQLWRNMSHDALQERVIKNNDIWKSLEQGAATSVWCACAKVWEGKKGRYCEDCQEGIPSSLDSPKGTFGYAPWAYDEVAEKKLWDISEEMVRPWS